MKDALRFVRQLYGYTSASDSGPLALKAVRQHMIDAEGMQTQQVGLHADQIAVTARKSNRSSQALAILREEYTPWL